jgi:hypothetical protein
MRVTNFHAGHRSFATNFTSSHKHTSFWLSQVDRHYAILTERESFGKFFLVAEKNYLANKFHFSPQAEGRLFYHKSEPLLIKYR